MCNLMVMSVLTSMLYVGARLITGRSAIPICLANFFKNMVRHRLKVDLI